MSTPRRDFRHHLRGVLAGSGSPNGARSREVGLLGFRERRQPWRTPLVRPRAESAPSRARRSTERARTSSTAWLKVRISSMTIVGSRPAANGCQGSSATSRSRHARATERRPNSFLKVQRNWRRPGHYCQLANPESADHPPARKSAASDTQSRGAGERMPDLRGEESRVAFACVPSAAGLADAADLRHPKAAEATSLSLARVGRRRNQRSASNPPLARRWSGRSYAAVPGFPYGCPIISLRSALGRLNLPSCTRAPWASSPSV